MELLGKEAMISLAALVISAVSLWYARRALVLSSRSLKTHLHPEISCFLFRNPGKPGSLLLVLKNGGPIAAVNVSVVYREFHWDADADDIYYSYSEGDLSDLWCFSPELPMNGEIAQEVQSVPERTKNLVRILTFDLSFYRDTDGQVYSKSCKYYVQGASIFRGSDFPEPEKLHQIDATLHRYVSRTREVIPDWASMRPRE
jgi:hypothetical protein